MSDKVTYYREVKASKDSDFHLYEWMPVAGEFIHMADLEPIEITEEEKELLWDEYCKTQHGTIGGTDTIIQAIYRAFISGYELALSKLKGDG